MTIDEWAEAERKHVVAFIQWWQQGHAENPRVFPYDLPRSEEWREQMYFWEQGR